MMWPTTKRAFSEARKTHASAMTSPSAAIAQRVNRVEVDREIGLRCLQRGIHRQRRFGPHLVDAADGQHAAPFTRPHRRYGEAEQFDHRVEIDPRLAFEFGGRDRAELLAHLNGGANDHDIDLAQRGDGPAKSAFRPAWCGQIGFDRMGFAAHRADLRHRFLGGVGEAERIVGLGGVIHGDIRTMLGEAQRNGAADRQAHPRDQASAAVHRKKGGGHAATILGRDAMRRGCALADPHGQQMGQAEDPTASDQSHAQFDPG